MEPVLAVAYILGFFAAVLVGRRRVGIPIAARLPLSAIFHNLPWFMGQFAAALLWPIYLGVWLVRGRPASSWKAFVADGRLLVRKQPIGC